MEQRDLEVWQSLGAAGAPRDIAELSARLAGVMVALAQNHADLTRARLAFALDQPASVAAGHGRFLAALEQTLQSLGVAEAPSRARAVADYGDGLMLHAIVARPGNPLDRGEVAAAIARLLG